MVRSTGSGCCTGTGNLSEHLSERLEACPVLGGPAGPVSQAQDGNGSRKQRVQRNPMPDSPMLGLSALIRRWISSVGAQAPAAELDSTTTSSWSVG